MKHFGLCTALVTMTLASAPARAQAPDVVIAVLKQLRAEASTSTDVVFDRVPLNAAAAREEQPISGAHEAHILDAVARVDGVRVAGSRDVVRCTEPHPRSCRLMGTDLLVAATPPVIDGDRATVDTYLRYPTTSKRQPVGSRGYRFHLERLQDGWAIVRRILLSES